MSWRWFSILAFVGGPVFACTTDLSAPADNFGSASPTGSVRVRSNLATLDFGGGLTLPIYLEFDSAKDGLNGPLGKGGWTMNILEPKAMPISERQMEVYLPTGLRLCLQKSRKDPNIWSSLRFEWVGKNQGDSLVVGCGSSEFQYWKGKLTRMRALDTSRTIEFVLYGSLISGVREGSGNLELEIKMEPSTGLPKTMVVNRQEFAFGFENGLLASITWPGGSKETYRRGTDPSGNPMLTVTGKQGGESVYTWNAKSRRIISDGEWTYEIGEHKPPYELPSLSRTDRKGRVESYFFNAHTGVSTYKAPDGTVTRCLFFLSPGLNYMRLRKVEQTVNGKTTTTLRRSYDERGLLTRETMLVDGAEQTRSYRYDQAGNQIAATRNGQALWERQYDQGKRLIKDVNFQTGKTLTRAYSSNGQREDVVDEKGKLSSTRYASDGKRLSEKLASGDQFSYEYDERGRLKSRKYNKELWEYKYDCNGRKAIITVNGRPKEQYTYASDGSWMEQKVYSKGGGAIETVFREEYDFNRRLVFERMVCGGKRETTIKYRYDGSGRLIEKDSSAEGLIQYQYANGQRTAVKVKTRG